MDKCELCGNRWEELHECVSDRTLPVPKDQNVDWEWIAQDEDLGEW
jgi:hypothetical protein